MTTMEKVRKRHIHLMRLTADILDHILRQAGQPSVSTLRDGPDGWTAMEAIGHIQAFDDYFLQRARQILAEDYPELPAYDHEQLARDHKYNERDLEDVLADFSDSRKTFVAFFRALSAEEWERAGIHPESGHFTMSDAAMQVGLHDANHIEQILRVLGQA